MNWNKFILCSGVTIAVVAMPVVSAQARSQPRLESPRASSAVSAPRPFVSQPARINPAPSSARTGNWNNRTRGSRGGHWRDGRGRGGHHHHGQRWHRHRHHFYYPYFGYYPFGYGYPYWGTSASPYYNGYYPQYSSRGGSGSLIADVQRELARAGYYRGAIDGIIGNGTRGAIRAYERANGLRVDGRLDSELLSTMGLG